MESAPNSLLSSFGFLYLGLAFFMLWLITLIRIIKHKFPGQNEKLMWALLVIFLPLIGMLVYFIFGRSREIRKKYGVLK